jgi:hypothetical protein
MKRFIICALMALCIGFALDAATDTGFTDDLKTSIVQMDSGDVGTALLATTTGVVVAPGATAEKPDFVTGKPKLWVIPQTEFDTLKAKYKHLYIIDIAFDASERYQFISRRPTKEVIQAMGSSKDDPFKIADLMINNMIVGGNKSDLDDGVVYSRVIELLTEIAKDGKKLFTKA